MTSEQFNSDLLTQAQRDAMRALHARSGIPWGDFLARSRVPTGLFPEVLVMGFAGMVVGIEPDGYTHS